MAWLIVGTQLEARPQGLGTHQQLGLPQCSFEAEYEMACPTCGMTTAFTLATQGRLIEASVVQPAGAAFALGLAMTAWLAGFVAWTGCRVDPLLRPLRTRWRWVLLAFACLTLGGWLTRLAAG